MTNKNKIGAVLIGLMFLLSLVAVATPVTANNLHMVNVVPNTGSEKADNIEIWDSTGKIATQSADPSTGGAWFSLLHGDYTAKVIKGGLVKDTINFTVNDTSTTTIIYNIPGGVSIPEKPVILAVVATSTTEATVSWDYSTTAPAVDGFKIFRNGTEITSVGPTFRSYGDTGLTADTTYSYYVRAYNAAGCADSDAVSVTTPQSGTTGDMLVHDLNFDDEVAPGSTQTFDLELQNNATYDAEDIIATIIIKDIAADNDDLEQEIDFGQIDIGDKEEKSVDITIPQDADDKLYTVSVDLEWKDAKGNKYTGSASNADWKIEVVKEKHQIAITSVQLDDTKYLPEDTVQVAVNLLNIGANDENVYVKATSDIGVMVAGATIKLKEGYASTQYLSFIVPEDTKAGKYFVVVNANYGSYSASKSIVLEIASTEAPTTVAVVTTDDDALGGNGAGIPVTEIALAVVIILLIGAIGWMAKDFIVAPKPAAKPIAASRSRVFK